MSNVAYIRVSTNEQNTDRQQFEGVTLDKVFEEKVSAKNTDRPQLKACMSYLREGDVLFVYSIDRFARSLIDLQSMVNQLTEKGVTIQFKKEGLTFNGNSESAMNKLIFQVMGAFAEFERNIIRERQSEGIAKAKLKGVYKGRKQIITDEQNKQIKEMKNNGVPISKIAKLFGVSRPTVYKALC